MREGQWTPAGVTAPAFRQARDELLAGLGREGLDVTLYASAFNPYPFLVPAERLAEMEAFGGAIGRALEAVVRHYLRDERLQRVIPLRPEERAVVERAEGLPYRIGSYRPDFLHGADGRLYVTEINARFPLNGYLSSVVLNRVVPRLVPEAGALPGLSALEPALRERLGGSGEIGILRSTEPGWDIHFLTTWWGGPSRTLAPDAVTEGDLSRWRAVVLELTQEELAAASRRPWFSALMEHRGLLNDLRTILVAHDKRLLSLLSAPEVLADYLEPGDRGLLARHVVPTWVKGLAPERVREMAGNPRGWLAKPPRSGKGRGIVVSHQLGAEPWRRALAELPDDWILQPYVDQECFPITVEDGGRVVTKPLRVVGVLPCLDGRSFGPAMYRASGDDIVNVARGGIILAPASGGGRRG